MATNEEEEKKESYYNSEEFKEEIRQEENLDYHKEKYYRWKEEHLRELEADFCQNNDDFEIFCSKEYEESSDY